MPGDFTATSRFIRAVALSQSALPVKETKEAVAHVFHILSSFDIPLGVIRDISENGEVYDYTQWTTASDLTKRKFYFHTTKDRAIRMVDLGNWKFTGSGKAELPMDQKQRITPLITADVLADPAVAN